MGHLKTLSMKVATNGLPILLILALVADLNVIDAIITALIFTVLAYIIGDISVLPKTGSAIAALADAGLAFLFFGVLNYLGILNLGIVTILYVALAVIIIEFSFYHPFLKRLVGIDAMGPRFGKRE